MPGMMKNKKKKPMASYGSGGKIKKYGTGGQTPVTPQMSAAALKKLAKQMGYDIMKKPSTKK
tara:strand:- start:3015 stop:3200 length:186 start_codon:yes stop_codon:yes gene_type:complete